MLVGRAGVLAASKKSKKFGLDDSKKKQGSDKASKYLDNDFSDDVESQIGEDQSRLQEKPKSLYQTPIGVWATGLLIFTLGLFLLITLASGNRSLLFKGFKEGHWWQYLICIFIIIIGLCFILAVKLEQLTIDRLNNTVQYSRKNIFCCNKIQERTLSELSSMYIVKRGHDSNMNKTIHYKIVLCFNDNGLNLEVLETNSNKKSKRRFQEIKRHLGERIDQKDIKIIDESTKSTSI